MELKSSGDEELSIRGASATEKGAGRDNKLCGCWKQESDPHGRVFRDAQAKRLIFHLNFRIPFGVDGSVSPNGLQGF